MLQVLLAVWDCAVDSCRHCSGSEQSGQLCKSAGEKKPWTAGPQSWVGVEGRCILTSHSHECRGALWNALVVELALIRECKRN